MISISIFRTKVYVSISSMLKVRREIEAINVK